MNVEKRAGVMRDSSSRGNDVENLIRQHKRQLHLLADIAQRPIPLNANYLLG